MTGSFQTMVTHGLSGTTTSSTSGSSSSTGATDMRLNLGWDGDERSPGQPARLGPPGRPGDTALLTDHYELTMLQAALRDGTAARHCVVRAVLPAAARGPPLRRGGRHRPAARGDPGLPVRRRGAGVSRRTRASSTTATCEWLADYRFGGDVSGYAEGELYFPGSPILTVDATFAEGVVLETLALSILNHDAAVASAAARMVVRRGRPAVHRDGLAAHPRGGGRRRGAGGLPRGLRRHLQPRGRPAATASPPPAPRPTRSPCCTTARPTRSARRSTRSGVGTTLLVDTYDIAAGHRARRSRWPARSSARSASTRATSRCWRTRPATQLDALGADGDPHRALRRPRRVRPRRAGRSRRSTPTASARPWSPARARRPPASSTSWSRSTAARSPSGRRTRSTHGGRKTAVRRHRATGTACEEVVRLAGRSRARDGDRALQVAVPEGRRARRRRSHPRAVPRAPAAGAHHRAVGGAQAVPRRARDPHEVRGAPMTEAASEARAIGDYDRQTALLVVDVQNDFADPAGGLYVGRRRGGRRPRQRSRSPRRRTPARPSSTPRTGTPSRRRTSRRTAASGRCTASAAPGAPSCYPNLIVHGPVVRKGTVRRGRLLRLLGARPRHRCGERRPSCSRCSPPEVRRLVVVGLAGDYCVKETALDGSAARLRGRGAARADPVRQPGARRRRADGRRAARPPASPSPSPPPHFQSRSCRSGKPLA